MISAVTGEVLFSDGLRFSPHEALRQAHLLDARSHVSLPIRGWTQHILGPHPCAYGLFEVEAVSDPESHVQAVLLSHQHSFYQAQTPADEERRTFHQGVIGSELHGQQEFAWGEVFCRLDEPGNRDWLVIVYNSGPPVPMTGKEALGSLREHEAEPGEESR